MKTKNIILALFFSVALISDSYALDNIIRPYQGVRSSGMGGLRTTTGLYDENFFGNPARTSLNPTWRVSLFDIMAETNSQMLDTGTGLSGKDAFNKADEFTGKNHHARVQTSFPSIYIPHLGHMSYAFGILTSTQFDGEIRKSYEIDPQLITDIGPALSVSRTFLPEDRLAVGTTLHATFRAATKNSITFADLIKGKSLTMKDIGKAGAGMDFDLGTQYRVNWKPKGWDVAPGLSINNVLDGKYDNLGMTPTGFGHPPRQQPRTFNFGASASKDTVWKFSKTTFAFEVNDIGNNPNGSYFRLFHIGGETRWGVLLPRLGINQGYWTAGLGLDLKVLTLDFATYGEEMTLNPGGKEDRRYALRLALQI